MSKPLNRVMGGIYRLALAGALGSACSSSDSGSSTAAAGNAVQLTFALRYQGQNVGCGDRLDGVGLTGSTVQLRDARVYLHDIQVTLATGETVPLSLDESLWQRDGVALVDFADDTGLCDTGSPETNTEVSGHYVGEAPVTGVRFRVGLPPELNHLDSARAPAPLNAPGMAWSWVGGYKYARIDVQSSGNDTWYIHLGATECSGSPAQGITCAQGNVAEIALDGLDSVRPSVSLDLDRVYAGSDLDAPLEEGADFVSGCMAFGGDPECAPIFSAFGMAFGTDSRVPAPCFSAMVAP
jgi:uncharacterized repeat protein (TIGR04052 family)